jgi:two-component system NtrC family sensor kinase
MVVTQGVSDEMTGLFATRNMTIAIILSGILAIILMTVFTTRMVIGRLREADLKTSEMNAQLMQSDKLAALGKMAAGIAHEINNPLQVIVQKTGWMQDLLDEEELKESENIAEFRKAIDKIEEHVERARKVVHGMLGYARKMEPHLEDVDVNAVITQTIDLLGNYARINNIAIKPQLSPDLPIIAADGAQLQQVFMNLIANAIDAIGHDGRIDVESRKTDSQLHIRVADNGPGISQEKQKKIFDPFFTTKETGRGTGLGLWISYNIIEKMGGTISLKSQAEQGAEFTVQIPVVIPVKK